MRRMITALLLVLGIPFAAMALPLSSADVAKLVQDSPPLEEYKGEHAVVWRRSILYSQDKDGRAVRQTSVVVLCDAAARLEWLTDLLYAPNGDCPCSYTVTGGDEPLRLTGRIAARAYPKAGSITVDEHGDYPAAQARELFEQFTPLLLRAMQEMLAECGAAASVQDFFPNFSCESSTRL